MNTPILQNGQNFLYFRSALQKSIRQSKIKDALYFSREIYISYPKYIWKKLFLSCIEDVGIGDISLLPKLKLLYQAHESAETKIKWYIVVRAISMLCEATKNHAAYNALSWLENNYSDVSGRDNIIKEYKKAIFSKDEQLSLKFLNTYEKKHRAKAMRETIKEIALVQCSVGVFGHIDACMWLLDDILSKKKYRLQVLVLCSIIICRANKSNSHLYELTKVSAKGGYTCDIPNYAIDSTCGGVDTPQSKRLLREVVYKEDIIYTTKK